MLYTNANFLNESEMKFIKDIQLGNIDSAIDLISRDVNKFCRYYS